ncbi:MAG: hypothetical protein COB62_03280 [Piscirickettsiaceae bacterium]|nr:MAG: hypothetical protein COB62_03280 [Piscirickettsiaceae bacterium]
MIHNLDAFAEFNPLTDKLPSNLEWEIGYVQQHALQHLPDNMTIEDLNAGLEILFQLSLKNSINAMLEHYEKDANRFQDTGLFTTPAFEHFLCTDCFKEGERQNGEKYFWSQVFAVAALACLSDYVTLSLNTVHTFQPGESIAAQINNQRDDTYQLQKPELKIDAVEYLGFARLFNDRHTRINSDKRRGETVSRKKLKNYHEVKFFMVEQYNALIKPISNRKAAKIIFESMEEKQRSQMANEDPEQQLNIWLGQAQKNKLAGQNKLPKFEW